MRFRPFVGVALLALTACGAGDPTEPGPLGPGAVATVTITPSQPQLEIPGHKISLRASARDADGTLVPGQTFTWNSSDASIVAVNDAGVTTALGIGTATITAKVAGITGNVQLKVTGLRSFTFLMGTWMVTRPDGSVEPSQADFRGLSGGILEETRTRGGAELLRVITRLEPDGQTWLYARADGERLRMQYFTGTIEAGVNRAIAWSVDGMHRVVLEHATTESFTLPIEPDDSGTWVDEITEENIP